jgi:hypothetical protein
MASYYVYSGAAGAANGTSWADAYTTLAVATSGKATSDIFYIANDHSESTAGAVTISTPTWGQFLCVNRAGSVPPVAADMTTGAQVKTSGDNNITFSAPICYVYGVTFVAGDGATGEVNISLQNTSLFDRCHFKIGSTGASSTLRSSVSQWENSTVEFSALGQMISFVNLIWRNTASAIVGTAPTTLMRAEAGGSGYIEAVDFSAVPSGKTIVSATNVGNTPVVMKDCKFATGVTVCSAVDSSAIAGLDVIRCDESSNYRHERYRGCGTQTTETTIIRTGGASDGVTPVAWKLVTATTVSVALPFESLPISVWNDTSGSAKTITVEGIWGGGAVPDNNDIWIDVEYLGDASSPQGSLVSSGVATILTTPSSYASSSETWGGSTTKFKMSATTGTIQQKGPITVRVYVALPSSTFYVCPKVTVS